MKNFFCLIKLNYCHLAMYPGFLNNGKFFEIPRRKLLRSQSGGLWGSCWNKDTWNRGRGLKTPSAAGCHAAGFQRPAWAPRPSCVSRWEDDRALLVSVEAVGNHKGISLILYHVLTLTLQKGVWKGKGLLFITQTF